LGEITESVTIKTFTGYEGIICGASAIYAGIASLMNEVYGKIIIIPFMLPSYAST